MLEGRRNRGLRASPRPWARRLWRAHSFSARLLRGGARGKRPPSTFLAAAARGTMGQTVGSVLVPNAAEHVFPPTPSSYGEDHQHLVRFPSGGDADVPAMLLTPTGYHSKRRDAVLGGRCGIGVSGAAGAAAASSSTVCIIYFHPNACDIGDSLQEMAAIRDLVFLGDAVVVAPEYTGYGLLSDYQPSVDSIDLVAMAAWRYCRRTLGFAAWRIVLWGRSIGTGPAAALAQSRARRSIERAEKRRELAPSKPVGAVVLVAPFTSVSDIVLAHSNSLFASLVSPFWAVRELVSDLALRDVPLCVVHPASDEIVPVEQGKAVLGASVAEAKEGIWLRGLSHNFSLEPGRVCDLRSFLKKHVGNCRGDDVAASGDQSHPGTCEGRDSQVRGQRGWVTPSDPNTSESGNSAENTPRSGQQTRSDGLSEGHDGVRADSSPSVEREAMAAFLLVPVS